MAESNDRLVVVGDLRLNTGPQFGVVLGLDNNGRLDNSFNNGQVLVIDRTGFSADFYYVSVQANGSIFAAGRSQFMTTMQVLLGWHGGCVATWRRVRAGLWRRGMGTVVQDGLD
nr:hypothetical protein [Pseudomonas sp. BIGb0427]